MVCHQRQGPVHIRRKRGQLSRQSVLQINEGVTSDAVPDCVPTQDVAALESQPLLGFMLKADSSEKIQFKLYHKHTLYYIFKADDTQTAQRYIKKSEAFCFFFCISYKNNYINVFLSLTGGLNRSGKQLFFKSLQYLILKNTF